MAARRPCSEERAMADGTELAQAHAAAAAGAWSGAYDAFALASTSVRLDGADLLAWSSAAILSGRDDEGCDLLANAFDRFVDDRDAARAGQCLLRAGLNLSNRGRDAALAGWMARGARLAADPELGHVVRGYLGVPRGRRAGEEGDAAGALTQFRLAQEVGEQVDDADLVALARMSLGYVRLMTGQVTEGLDELDDVMVGVTGGRVSPVVAGVIYCVVVRMCREALDVRRAREWTFALDAWCERQPQLVPFRGTCRVHRSQVLLETDAWDQALLEADLAVAALSTPPQGDLGVAWYQKGEVHRVRGELDRAQDAFRQALEAGGDPEPGLALTWFASGRAADAFGLLRGAMERVGPPRPLLLAAVVEVGVAVDDLPTARRAVAMLAGQASDPASGSCLQAIAATADGTVRFADGDVRGAERSLLRALDLWLGLTVPYEVARVRVRLAAVHRARGDDAAAELGLEAARSTFRRLGASADLVALEGPAIVAPAGGLSPREAEVLRLAATGRTNRAIATELHLSEKTVARHLSNLFAKLDVPSRAAATAWAYEHGVL
ncbi:LuxR C-terminal-related transcriptional regulator [Cellulomonas sp. McL0617]|uniref:LuxR C-terminal-related transcriptional regulator n=1 Tax=Cellulomonas sp. McL0617 TaxID=3415675 RepID=UPI003CF7C682